MFKNWGKDVEVPERITREDVQEMIDDAIKHNRMLPFLCVLGGLFLHFLLRVCFDLSE